MSEFSHNMGLGMDLPKAHLGTEVPVDAVMRIGNYTIRRSEGRPVQLGAGGSAAVLLAEETDTPQAERVAVALQTGELYRPHDFRRNLNWHVSLVAAGVQHIPPVLDAGVGHINNESGNAEAAYMVTPVAEGGTLKEVLKERKLAPLEVISLVDQLAETLTAVHDVDDEGIARGIVHGDVTSKNVLVTEPVSPNPAVILPEIWLTDWEAADRPTHGKQWFKTSSVNISPEEFSGKSTHQSDIYRAGLLTFEAITGEPLWNQDTKEDHEKVIRSGEHDAFIKKRLEVVDPLYEPFLAPVKRALMQDLDQRYHEISNFALGMKEEWFEAANEIADQEASVVYEVSHNKVA